MFNRRKIKQLEYEVKWLTKEKDELRDKYWQLRRDIDHLAANQGLKFEDINKRILTKKDEKV